MSITQVTSKLFRCQRSDLYLPANKAYIESNIGTIVSLEGLEEDYKEQDYFRNPQGDPKGKVVIPVISCPISTWQIIVTGISQEYYSWILDLVISLDRAMVHCEQNHDRTGLIVAGYRVRKCGWTKDMAMKEALAFGFSWKNFGLKKTWAGFNG